MSPTKFSAGTDLSMTFLQNVPPSAQNCQFKHEMGCLFEGWMGSGELVAVALHSKHFQVTLCGRFPTFKRATICYPKRDISQNCLLKHFCNLLFSTSKSSLLKNIPPIPKRCTDLLHQPTKLMTTRCRIVLAKRKSAKARSGEIP